MDLGQWERQTPPTHTHTAAEVDGVGGTGPRGSAPRVTSHVYLRCGGGQSTGGSYRSYIGASGALHVPGEGTTLLCFTAFDPVSSARRGPGVGGCYLTNCCIIIGTVTVVFERFQA